MQFTVCWKRHELRRDNANGAQKETCVAHTERVCSDHPDVARVRSWQQWSGWHPNTHDRDAGPPNRLGECTRPASVHMPLAQPWRGLVLCPTPFCVLQVAQIAHFLDLPASSPTLSHITASGETNTALRQALETTCRIRDRVVSLSDLQREMVDDIEVNVLLQVLKYTLRDSCHWVRTEKC